MLPPTSRRRDIVLHWATFAAVLLLKIALVAENEVVSSKFDGYSYVTLASFAEPWRVIGWTPPGYSFWLWADRWFAIPQRVAIELLYVTCCGVFARSIGSSLAGFRGFAAVFVVTALSPVTFYLFDQTLSDGFYLCLSLLACGLSIRLILSVSWKRRSLVDVVVLGLTFGWMDLTRREAPVTAVILAALTIALLARFRYGEQASWRAAIGKSFFIVATAALTAWLVSFVVLLEHGRTEGVRSSTFAEIPSHLALLKRLASIDTGEPPLRFIPISHRARQLAYDASPTLEQFKAPVEDPTNVHQVASVESLGKPGEIGAGWIWHVFILAGQTLGHRSPRELDVTFRQVNEELDAAFASGRLTKHVVIHPLIGAPSTWAPHFLESLLAVSNRAWSAVPPQQDAGIDAALFDRVCFRRTSLVPAPTTMLSGWAFALPGREVAVFARDASGGNDRLIPTMRNERSDVRDGYAKQGLVVPGSIGFWARLVVDEPSSLRLEFRDDDGEILSSGPLSSGQMQTIRSVRGHDVVVGVDSVSGSIAPRAIDGWRTSSMTKLAAGYRAISAWVVLAMCVPIAAYLLLGHPSSERPASRQKSLAILFVMAWLGARLVLYALVDAAGWVAEPRYVTGISVMFVGVAVACLLGSVTQLHRRLAGTRRAPAHERSPGIARPTIDQKRRGG